jgi:hypothetical protein
MSTGPGRRSGPRPVSFAGFPSFCRTQSLASHKCANLIRPARDDALGERPVIERRRAADTGSGSRGEGIAAQDPAERIQAPTITPTLHERLNGVEQIGVVCKRHGRETVR